MESAQTALRFRLILGKFRVINVFPGTTGFKAIIDLGNSVRLTMDVPVSADLRTGDLLTFYTEVPAHAEPIPSSLQ